MSDDILFTGQELNLFQHTELDITRPLFNSLSTIHIIIVRRYLSIYIQR